jgi:hypothetical protein
MASARKSAALVCGALIAGTASADCSGLIEAFERARHETRVAQMLVDATGHPQGTEPVTLRIGDTIYEDFDGIEYRTRRADPVQAVAEQLRRDPQAAQGERLGEETFAGLDVVRFRFIYADIDRSNNPVTLLVARQRLADLSHLRWLRRTWICMGLRRCGARAAKCAGAAQLVEFWVYQAAQGGDVRAQAPFNRSKSHGSTRLDPRHLYRYCAGAAGRLRCRRV